MTRRARGWGLAAVLLGAAGSAGCCHREPSPTLVAEPPASASGPSSGEGASVKAPPPVPGLSASAPGKGPEPPRLAEAQWFPRGNKLLGALGARAAVIDVETGQAVEVDAGGPIDAMAVAPSGEVFALSAGPLVAVYRSEGAKLASFRVAGDKPSPLVWTDGRRVLASGERLRVWSVEGGASLLDIEAPVENPSGAAVFPDGTYLVEVTLFSAVVIDVARGQQVGEVHDTETGATFLTSVSPDGRWVAAGADAGHTLKVWRTHPWQLAATPGRAASCQQHVGPWFSDDGKLMLASFGRVSLKTYEVGSFRPVKTTPLDENSEVSPDGSIAVFVDEKQAKTFDPRTRKTIAPLPLPVDGRYQLSPDGQHLLSLEGQAYVLRSSRTGQITASWPPR